MKLAWGPRARPGPPLIVFPGMGAVLLLMGRFYPFDKYPLVTCPLKRWAHIPCATCGMTRAFVRITHGQWRSAFVVSPLGALLAITAAVFLVYAALRLTVLRRGVAIQFSERESKVVRIGAGALLLINWIYLIVSGAAA